MRVLRTLPIVAAAALLLSACATTADPGGTASEAPGDASAFPVTIEHAFGETTIPKKPTRVATVAWANHEVPLALGVVPVIFEKATWGDDDNDGVLPWVREKLDELGVDEPTMYDPTDGIDFAAVADAEPDVILASYSGLSKEDYDKLTKIAPVVAYPEIAWGTSYEEMIELNSKALGLEKEGEALVAALDADVKEALTAHPGLVGKKALFASFDPNDLSQIGIYTSNDTRPAFLDHYGLPFPAVVSEQGASGGAFYSQLSAENVESFADVDVIVTYADASLLPSLQADPLLSKIPAVAAGRIAFVGANGPLATSANPTPLSIPSTIGDYFAVLDKALSGTE